MDRDMQISSIISFVDSNRESMASKMVCAKVLGQKNERINDEIVRELHARLPRAKQEVIDDCFEIIK
ncbi:hypothetical protein SAMN02745135_01762 [Caloranaerobacter azorensis DSM 13643]|uniref:Uncharacterized protein n=1 Tax=Caloranaerobacter azorensis DSM 13643 TaxID=1121264 RepID=A0A1M5V623_9FIRM|nr:hypothetical protein [Caloranaerobacter azorensis]SHH70685.1 hypothetical protein SAMN02745135_01762 [Caloranaerobacter azorensis DSM 13643]